MSLILNNKDFALALLNSVSTLFCSSPFFFSNFHNKILFDSIVALKETEWDDTYDQICEKLEALKKYPNEVINSFLSIEFHLVPKFYSNEFNYLIHGLIKFFDFALYKKYLSLYTENVTNQ